MYTSTRPAADHAGVIAAYRTCEFATVTRRGTPMAWPLVSWQRPDGTFVLTTSIAFPQKAYNIRRNPAVAMLFSDPTASGLVDPPQILVQGSATCPDEIVGDVGNLPEYWTQLMRRQPSGKFLSSAIGRRVMGFYYLRLIITVTPTAVTARSAVPADSPLVAPVLSSAQQDTPFGEVATRLPGYRSGVLAAFDDAGRPTLQRVRPVADVPGAALILDVPAGVDLRPGPASLLCHSHDDELDSQTSFVVAGTLVPRDGGWAMATERFIPGPGTGGALAMIQTVRGLRSNARRYLDHSGLQRPAVDWAAIDQLWTRARATA